MSKSDLLQALESSIDWTALDGGSIVVACSGGADSTALACVVAQFLNHPDCDVLWPTARPHLVLWHLDHQLREASAQDADFVRQLGVKLGAQVIVERRDIGTLARLQRKNIEAVAREQRYTLLAVLCDPSQDDRRIARPALACTAHHLQDQAETILMRLLRGAQAKGLRGILPWHGSSIFRPWLKVPRSQILGYLAEKGQDYVHDASNLDRRRIRNLIRHEVLPLLDSISGDKAAQRISRLAQVAVQASAHIESQLNALQVTCLDQVKLAQCLPVATKADGLYAAHFARQHWLAGSVLVDYVVAEFARQGITLEDRHLENLDVLETHPSRPVYLQGWSVSLGAPDCLLIASQLAGKRHTLQLVLSEQQPTVTDSVSIFLAQAATSATLSGDGDGGYSSFGAVKTWHKMLAQLAQGFPGRLEWRCRLPAAVRLPLSMRTWRYGDRIELTNGMSKKLSDIFIDAKVPPAFRAVWLVLVDAGGEIIWVPGLADSRHMAAGAAAPGWEVRIVAQPHVVTGPAGKSATGVLHGEEQRDDRV